LSEEVVKGADRGTEVIGEAEEQWLEEEQDEEEEEQEGVEVEGSGGGGGATAGRGAPIIASTNFCLSQYTPASSFFRARKMSASRLSERRVFVSADVSGTFGTSKTTLFNPHPNPNSRHSTTLPSLFNALLKEATCPVEV
jgi:hypothetical protein